MGDSFLSKTIPFKLPKLVQKLERKGVFAAHPLEAANNYEKTVLATIMNAIETRAKTTPVIIPRRACDPPNMKMMAMINIATQKVWGVIFSSSALGRSWRTQKRS